MKKDKQATQPKKKAPQPAAKRKREDSDDIERAVYDGMQDLRVKKPAGK